MRKFRCRLATAAAVFTIPLLLAVTPVRHITIIYTNSLNGNIDYCLCPSSPKGGLVKRSSEINRIRALYNNTFLFETGDFLSPDEDPLLASYIIKSYAHIGYEAVLTGDQEFNIGINKFIKHSASLPLVCGNILFKNKGGFAPAFNKFMIIEKAGVKAGVASTISPEVINYLPAETASEIKVPDQIDELNKDIKSLKERGADIIIVLSHSGYDRDLELAEAVTGIDLIIGGHSQTMIKKPEKKGRTLIVQAGADGSHIGILELQIGSNGISSYKNSFRLPDHKSHPDDPVIRSFINSYQTELRKKTGN
jgi:2',3'-cyclic-nucleotide 2'-phosphodiesterase (5'-nucleotidase family)